MSALPMTADLVARLEAEAGYTHTLIAASVGERREYLAVREALLREAASALRSSGEADGFEAAWHKVCDALDYADPDWMMYGPEGADAVSALIRKLATPASAWRPIAEAQEGKLYVVGWLDGEDTKSPARHDFDYIEDGCWVWHEDCVQHAEACAPPGSRLPSREPPYRWLIEVPDFPTPPTSTKGG